MGLVVGRADKVVVLAMLLVAVIAMLAAIALEARVPVPADSAGGRQDGAHSPKRAAAAHSGRYYLHSRLSGIITSTPFQGYDKHAHAHSIQ